MLPTTEMPPTELSDLPYELKEKIAFECDFWSYEKLRACDKVFNSMPASTTVRFEGYQQLLKDLKLEIWEFGGDTEEWEDGFWWYERGRSNGPIALEFQKRIHLDFTRLNQDQYLYLCRNGLAQEVCRIVKTCLMESEGFSHIDLTVTNKSEKDNEQGIFSLGFAIVANDVDLVSALLQHNGIDGKNINIILASEYGHVEVARLLLQDVRVDPSSLNNAAIRIAAGSGHLEVVQLLLQDIRVDPSSLNNRAIISASQSGHADVVRLLMQDIRVDPSTLDNCAIRSASESGHDDVVRLLLQDVRVDPSVWSNAAIRVASDAGHLEVVEVLLKDDRVDPSAFKNYAIKQASKNGHLKVVDLLSKDRRFFKRYGTNWRGHAF